MGKVAIVGVEGSGKTVLMASLTECFGKVSDQDLYLMPENQTAYMFMKQIPHRLRVDRQWPDATGINCLRSMKWTVRCGQNVIKTVEMLEPTQYLPDVRSAAISRTVRCSPVLIRKPDPASASSKGATAATYPLCLARINVANVHWAQRSWSLHRS